MTGIMEHLFHHLLVRFAVYPAFYWVGFVVVRGLSVGRAPVLPYAELGQDAAWWEFRVRRSGFTKYWRAESLIIIGGNVVLLTVGGYFICRYLL